MILPEKDYTPHRSEVMRKYRYKVVFSDISSLKEGETVYRIRDKHTIFADWSHIPQIVRV